MTAADLDHHARLLRTAANREEAREPLQEVAVLAAAGNDQAVEALLTAIDKLSLARPAIKRQLFNVEDQLDVEQDVLIAVSTSIAGFRGEAHILTWLHTVATNSALRFVRRRRETEGLDGIDASWNARFTSIATDQMAVRKAIAMLPEHYCLAVTLRDLDRFSYAEIAEQLDLNINTVRAHIARGRALVSKELGGSVPQMEEL